MDKPPCPKSLSAFNTHLLWHRHLPGQGFVTTTRALGIELVAVLRGQFETLAPSKLDLFSVSSFYLSNSVSCGTPNARGHQAGDTYAALACAV